MYTFRTRCGCLDGQIEKEHFERKIGWTKREKAYSNEGVGRKRCNCIIFASKKMSSRGVQKKKKCHHVIFFPARQIVNCGDTLRKRVIFNFQSLFPLVIDVWDRDCDRDTQTHERIYIFFVSFIHLPLFHLDFFF